ncbi:MAG: flavin reductase family protein [Chloroflexi bacterium]|nr:flavin reductase family protein [Chloroflexota bacterium]
MSENPISDALNAIPYGFYALTSRDGDDRNVMVVNWFTQVSFEPQHVGIGLQVTSYTYGLIEKGQVFGINVFHKDDAEVIKQFTKSREKNPEKFEAANYSDGEVTGVPILDEAAAYMECEVVGKVETGSGHDMIVGKVVAAGLRKELKVEDTLTLPDIGWSYAG